MNDPGLLLHLHVVKAAGSTLWRVLEREYGAQAALHLPKTIDDGVGARINARPGLRVVTGHFYYGLHGAIERPCRYLVLVREPVERIVSYYNHALTRPSSRLHARVTRERMDLETFVNEVRTPWMHDAQVHALAGRAQGPDLLQRARDHLARDFVFAGTVAGFDPAVLTLRRRLGWRRIPFYVRRSRSPRLVSAGAALQRRIRELNPLDRRLYEQVRGAEAAAWKAAGGVAAMQLRVFRLLNRLYALRLLPNNVRGLARSARGRLARR